MKYDKKGWSYNQDLKCSCRQKCQLSIVGNVDGHVNIDRYFGKNH